MYALTLTKGGTSRRPLIYLYTSTIQYGAVHYSTVQYYCVLYSSIQVQASQGKDACRGDLVLNRLLILQGYTPKGIKAKGIKAFCKPKGIKGPKVLKVVPKQETEIPKVLKVSAHVWPIFGTDQRY